MGVLLNTRGLTELIALNIGLQAGIIDRRLYTILVIMALLTTLLTGPLLSVLRFPRTAEIVNGTTASRPPRRPTQRRESASPRRTGGSADVGLLKRCNEYLGKDAGYWLLAGASVHETPDHPVKDQK